MGQDFKIKTMNWGKGITLVIIAFMAFIVSMVFRAFGRDADLVREDYYENEVNFDNNKESVLNYKALADSVQIIKKPEGVVIYFPPIFDNSTQGKIKFYRPDNKKFDREFSIQLEQLNEQNLAYTNFKEGYYDVTIDWMAKGKSYRYQSNISF